MQTQLSPNKTSNQPQTSEKTDLIDNTEQSLRMAILQKISSSTSSKTKYKQLVSYQIQTITPNKQNRFLSGPTGLAKQLFVDKNIELNQNIDQISPLRKQLYAMISPHPHPHIYDTFNYEQQILNLQSKNNPGFYQYQNWVQFTKKHYENTPAKINTDLWKILRIINYGQVNIPSGLIYDLHIFFQMKKQGQKNINNCKNIKQILQKFLCDNHMADKLRNFREIGHYTDLQVIQGSYVGNNQKNTQSVKYEKNNRQIVHFSTKPLKNKYTSIPKYQNKQADEDVWKRNFKDAYRRRSQKILKCCQSIINQDTQCKFKPQTHQVPKRQSSCKTQKKVNRFCHKIQHQLQEISQIKDEKQNIKNLLKSKSINPSIMQDQLLENIPGVSLFLDRNKNYSAQKLRVHRNAQKPSYTKNYIQKYHSQFKM